MVDAMVDAMADAMLDAMVDAMVGGPRQSEIGWPKSATVPLS